MPLEGITEGAHPDIGAFPSGKPAWKAGCDLKNPRDIAFVRPHFTFLNMLVNHGFEEKDTLAPWVSTGSKSAKPIRSAGVCWRNPGADVAFRFFGAAAPFPKAGWIEIDLTDYVKKRLSASGIVSIAFPGRSLGTRRWAATFTSDGSQSSSVF